MKVTATRILFLFCLMALLAIGVDWILYTSQVLSAFTFGKADAYQGMRSISGGTLSFWAGVALVLLPLLALASWLLIGRDDSIRARAKDGDLIRLQPEAIERSVTRAVKEKCEEVIKVRAEARQGKRLAPFVRIHVAVLDTLPVPQVRTNVRAVAVEVLDHLLGLSDPRQVHVVIHDIANAEAGRPRRKRPAPEGKKSRRPADSARKPAERRALPAESVEKSSAPKPPAPKAPEA